MWNKATWTHFTDEESIVGKRLYYALFGIDYHFELEAVSYVYSLGFSIEDEMKYNASLQIYDDPLKEAEKRGVDYNRALSFIVF